jgi:hypothetical protein
MEKYWQRLRLHVLHRDNIINDTELKCGLEFWEYEERPTVITDLGMTMDYENNKMYSTDKFDI